MSQTFSWPSLVPRSYIDDLNCHIAALEMQHRLDVQSLDLAEIEIACLKEQLDLVRSLNAANRRETNRITHERDQALAEVQRLSDEDRRHRQAMRFWIERATEPHICHN